MARHNVIYVKAWCARDNPLGTLYRVRQTQLMGFGGVVSYPGCQSFFSFRSKAVIEILASGAKSNINLWLSFFEDFNGRLFFFGDVWETSQSLQLYRFGFGAVFGRHWFYGSWPGHWKTYNIALSELFLIVIAVHIWESLMSKSVSCSSLTVPLLWMLSITRH